MFEAKTILARGRATSEAFEIAPAGAGNDGRTEEPLELTLVDAVVAACELSEDETEVRDLVDAIVRRPDVRIVAEAPPPSWARSRGRIRHKAA